MPEFESLANPIMSTYEPVRGGDVGILPSASPLSFEEWMNEYYPGIGKGVGGVAPVYHGYYQDYLNNFSSSSEPIEETSEVGSSNLDIGSAVDDALEGGFSISDYISSNPGASAEEILAAAANENDEYAEKYLDYILEQEALDKANAYTANREDTAYQRLVQDLRAAGLNPAMMYGSSASISAGGSQGYVKVSEGASSRSINNYSKMKQILLNYLQYELKKGLGITNAVFDGIDSIASILKLFFK